MLKILIESTLEDPRSKRQKTYSLYDIVGLALLSSLSGETSYTGMEEFGHLHAQDLAQYFGIQSIPSHDTIRLLFDRLNPDNFLGLFNSFLENITQSRESREQDVISLDGKTIRHSGDHPLHVVSAWSSQNRLILAHQKTDGKGTEIKALKEILDVLDINGHIVTTDALGCQKEITQRICDGGGDYVLQVKGNQKGLLEILKSYVEDTEMSSSCTSYDKKRGWVQEVTTTVASDIGFLQTECPGWSGIQSVVKVAKTMTKRKKSSYEERFYITSFISNPIEILGITRKHWEIENNVHWVLDVMFNEDKACIRTSNAPENLNLLKKIGINIFYTIQKRSSKTISLKTIQRRFTKPSAAADMIENYLKFIHS